MIKRKYKLNNSSIRNSLNKFKYKQKYSLNNNMELN